MHNHARPLVKLAGAAGFICLLIAGARFSFGQDAAQIYAQAAAAIKEYSPSETAVRYPGFPPSSSPDWMRDEKKAFDANTGMFRLVRQASSLQHANWPDNAADLNISLNNLRGLNLQLADATLYTDAQGNDAQAFEFIQDLRHLADLLRQRPMRLIRCILAAAFENTAAYHAEAIAAGMTLTDDPADKRHLQVKSARQLIAELLRQRDPNVQAIEVLASEGAEADQSQPRDTRLMIPELKLAEMENDFAAMSLACQVFRFDKNHWPDSLDDLIPAYLPRPIVDPLGDGKQTLGYVVIPSGLPDGSDRPLLYSRFRSDNGLFYLTRGPLYGLYVTDGSNRPYAQTKHGGQFRDVARWARPAGQTGPATRPLASANERSGPAVQPASAGDAAATYLQAAAMAGMAPPTATTAMRSYPPPDYLPSFADWRTTAAKAWNADARSRQLVHSARNLTRADWAIDNFADLWSVYMLGINLSDAALYADFQGDHSEAVELIQDQYHMANLLEENPSRDVGRVLIASGIRAIAPGRLMQIVSYESLTRNPADAQSIQAATVRQLISQLLDQRDPSVQLAQAFAADRAATDGRIDYDRDKILEGLKRVNGEQSLAAMALACQLFHFDKGRWPQSLDDLIPAYLPRAIIDPWGDGKQTLGYVLVKGGLPDGADRPLVYSRCMSSDGLFFMANQPRSYFYTDDGTPMRANSQFKHGGQFRDLTRWEPAANYSGPTTRPLNPL